MSSPLINKKIIHGGTKNVTMVNGSKVRNKYIVIKVCHMFILQSNRKYNNFVLY